MAEKNYFNLFPNTGDCVVNKGPASNYKRHGVVFIGLFVMSLTVGVASSVVVTVKFLNFFMRKIE